jgi:hypothetical protein
MVSENALQDHMAACELTYQLMLDENRLLKTTGAPPGNDFLDQKRTALRQLELTLEMLRGGVPGDNPPGVRALIQKTQQIVMKALLLDRENEQLLLKCTTPKRFEVPQVRPTLDQIQKIYRKYSA